MSVANLFTDPTSQIFKVSSAQWNEIASGGVISPETTTVDLKWYFGGQEVATVPTQFYRIGYIVSVLFDFGHMTGSLEFPSGSPPQLLQTEPIPSQYAGSTSTVSNQIGTMMMAGQAYNALGDTHPTHYIQCPVSLIQDTSPSQTIFSLSSPDWGVLSDPTTPPTTWELYKGDFRGQWIYSPQSSVGFSPSIQFVYTLTDLD